MKPKILVVDDEKDIVDLLVYNLERAGLGVLKAYDGETALRKATTESPDLAVLDVMLPGMDGWELLRRLRQDKKTAVMPVIMLTARGDETDKVLGLELGADDYLTKPFSPKELVARVRALLRRSRPVPDGTAKARLEFSDLEIDPESFGVRYGKAVKKEAVLTAKEFQLLYYLASRPGRVVTREVLLDDIWDMDSEVETRTVDVHMRRLREKLGPSAAHLQTLRGVGYKFSEK
ncbi:MAG: response regulator transcription factor [candidate division FCPU426 bacterium]